jgi:hypothetical protein
VAHEPRVAINGKKSAGRTKRKSTRPRGIRLVHLDELTKVQPQKIKSTQRTSAWPERKAQAPPAADAFDSG